jgi:hypothetical protein
MEIEFEFSGGYGGLFAGQPLVFRARTDELPQDVRERLSNLIQAAGLDTIETDEASPRGGPARDTFQYRLVLRDRGGVRSFSFDDVNAPAAVHPLLACLRELAIARRADEK